ncbi:hypothetical protein SASPL_112095 [Salvia splendens]|uniref:Uncharacterized protein n=2 Tax=Salvia splendens TaxID=180675 RepID=A0A8X8YDS8_SALSN|nr:hypothetical protein SASPL_112095 [Salvia splendens]
MKEVVLLLSTAAPVAAWIKSVKYSEDLMARDDGDGGGGDGRNGYEDESSVYGVFGALEAQKMEAPFRRYGERR